MLRLAKGQGIGNVYLEDTDIPAIGPREVLVEVQRSLISRGSELGGRYLTEAPVDPARMGYAVAGKIVQVGEQVTEFQVGDRVAALKPHAQLVTANLDDTRHPPEVVRLPDNVSLEAGTFWPFLTSGVSWAIAADIKRGDTVAVVGQGIVGCVMQQLVRRHQPGRVIAVDALALRCEIARRLGADDVIDASAGDPVAALSQLTEGQGAQVVIEAVSGKWAASAFPQIQSMVAPRGSIVLIGLYHDQPLPLDAAKLMSRRIIGANSADTSRPECSEVALQILGADGIKTEPIITHRFPYTQAKEAFDLLNDRPGEALGVILEW